METERKTYIAEAKAVVKKDPVIAKMLVKNVVRDCRVRCADMPLRHEGEATTRVVLSTHRFLLESLSSACV